MFLRIMKYRSLVSLPPPSHIVTTCVGSRHPRVPRAMRERKENNRPFGAMAPPPLRFLPPSTGSTKRVIKGGWRHQKPNPPFRPPPPPRQCTCAAAIGSWYSQWKDGRTGGKRLKILGRREGEEEKIWGDVLVAGALAAVRQAMPPRSLYLYLPATN